MDKKCKVAIVTVPFKLLREDESNRTPAPAYAFVDDAGADLTITRDVFVDAGAYAQIPTNLAFAIPDGYWGALAPRSSTFYRKFLLVHNGVIDSGYRGEVMACVYNNGGKRCQIRTGERLFQVILVEKVKVKWVQTTDLPETARGEGGFGSTGGYTEEVKVP